jgi:hypothetical protein
MQKKRVSREGYLKAEEKLLIIYVHKKKRASKS